MKERLSFFCLMAAFGLPLTVYCCTAAPGPFWEDSATFSMAAATLSIPHSPSFPLWILIGKLFTWFNPSNPARATNLLSGFFGAGAAALFYLCVRKILGKLAPALGGDFAGEEGTIYCAPTITLTALGAALVFAFSLTVWLQSVRAEVYSLQLVLTLAAFLMALSLNEAEQPTRFFLLAAFLWGLSLTVHPLLSVSVLPGLLIIGCFKSANWKKEFAKWGWAFGLILLAFAVYLYLPLRSINNPYLNWNQPDNWERFVSAVTRSGSWGASVAATSTNVSYANVMRLLTFLVSEYSIIFWIVSLFGTLVLARHRPKAGVAIFGLLLSNFFVTLWAAVFDTRNLDLFGYLSFGTGMAVISAAVGLFAAVGWAAKRFSRLSPKIAWAVPALAGGMAFFLAGKNWAKADLHQSDWPQKIAQEIFRSLPPNSVVFFSSDRLLTPILYQQGVLRERPDVAVVLINVFFQRFLNGQTQRRYPDLVFDSINTELKGRAQLREGFRAFCLKNKRPIFTQLGYHIADCRNFWPAGYLLEYRTEPVGPEVPQTVLDFVRKTFTGKPDFLSREGLGLEIYNWGAYLSKIGAPEQATLYSWAGDFDSDNPRAWVTVGKAFLFLRRFALAENCFKLALAYDPYWGDAYFLLSSALLAQGKTEEAMAATAEGDFLVPDKRMEKKSEKNIRPPSPRAEIDK